ncbi:MAG: sigma 54-interacting transcriptional regulator [Myxococcales bacterium]|jgi:transcriptional regulator with GAF, ATPase, and Fis domain
MGGTQTQTGTVDRITEGGVHRLLVLLAADEGDVGFSRVLALDPLVVGRAPEGSPSLALRDGRISRRHAQVEPDAEGGYTIRDLDSRNGTYVNGRRLEPNVPCPLEDGDVVRMGSALLLLQFLDAEACRRLLEHAPIDAGPIVGDSHAMMAVRDAIRRAPRGSPTLILGETGVGKELVARAVHEHSGREGPFVPVNCSALPDNLVESELFGHVRGAFTGAEARKGLFVEAERGTLLLDEIGELELDLQAKLLRALAVGEIRPVGADRPRIVDVAVVAATHVDLEQAVEDGRFRKDLYARLLSHVIRVPPLRARKEDVLPLARHFLGRGPGPCFTPDAAEALLVHDWPYNVRELEQLLSPVAGALGEDALVELRDLPPRLHEPLADRLEAVPTATSVPVELLGIRRDARPTADELRAVARAHDGNVAQVAAFFGKDRRQIYRWADAHGIDLQAFRGAGDRQGED